MAEKILLESVGVICRKQKGEVVWLLVKQESDGDWELPRGMVRKGESSVRAAIRTMSEKLGMKAKVLEEAGRSGGAAKIKEQIVTKRTLYYLMQYRDGFEMLGVFEAKWMSYKEAIKKISSKREQGMLKEAKNIIDEKIEEGFKFKKYEEEEILAE
jgi:ADP-ribose pyrophosphatase YjhB (NUDIX family)